MLRGPRGNVRQVQLFGIVKHIRKGHTLFFFRACLPNECLLPRPRRKRRNNVINHKFYVPSLQDVVQKPNVIYCCVYEVTQQERAKYNWKNKHFLTRIYLIKIWLVHISILSSAHSSKWSCFFCCSKGTTTLILKSKETTDTTIFCLTNCRIVLYELLW